MIKKVFCLMLMLCTVFNIFPVSAIGASGVCGDDAQWYTSGTTLYITGKGDVTSRGWDDCKENIWSAVVSEGITSIPGEAFSRCPKLESVTLPSTLKSIGMHAFQYTDSIKSITIPNGVETIGYGAFYDCGLTSVTIPQSVKTLETYAFYACTEMTTVTILGNNLKNIGPDAFAVCSKLSSINLPYGLEQIDDNAFYMCRKLETISIPRTVKYIGSGVFKASGFDNDDAYKTGNGLYIDDCLISVKNDQDNAGTYTVRPGTRLIAEGAASGVVGYTDYVLPSGIEYICSAAFSFNKHIVSINLPAGIKEIGASAFSYCEKLRSISIPDTVTEIQTNTFRDCKSLVSITIPETVTKIGSEAFMGCTSLVNLNIPDSVTSIGENAYEDTGYCSFETSWTDGLIYYNGYLLHSSEFVPEDITVKAGTRLIADSAFDEAYYYIKSITLPQGLEVIGNEAFMYCSQITEIDIPESVTHIGDNAFEYCRMLTGIKLPEKLKYLGAAAFASCENLTEVNIPAGIGEIMPDTFYYCDIMTLEIPEGITSIGHGAFRNCSYLVSLSLPDSLKHIGAEAFSLCGMAAIIVPSGVETVGEGAFSDIPNVILPYTGEKSEMWHPSNAVDELSTTQGRIKTLKITHETEVAPKAFIKMSGDTFIDLNDGITKIGELAFAETDGLTVYIPESVTEIADNAFADAKNITLQVFEGSKALEFAKSKGISYEITKGREEKIYVTAIQQHGKTAAGVVTDGNGSGRIVVAGMESGFDSILEAKHISISKNASYGFVFDNDTPYGVRVFRLDDNLAPLTADKYVKVKYSDFD